MSGFKVELQTAGPHVVTDLGLTLNGAIGTVVDLTAEEPNNIARSADLEALVTSGDILVVDARDDTDTTIMTLANSLEAIRNHNDTHFGITGGRFGGVDDPTVTPTDGFIIQYDSGGDTVEYIDPATLVTQAPVQEAIEDIVGGMGIDGTDTTFTYVDGAGTIQWNVDDVFLRNTGDTLDSGTFTIASGATVDFPTGSNLTIAGDVSSATIETPVGGFVNDNDLINKLYVDQVASGLDWKESARASTTIADGDITGGSFGGTYTAGGGPNASGEFTGVDLSAGTGGTIDGINFTGTSSTGFVVGDRIVIKNQTDKTQNGIYEITAAPTDDNVTLTRAGDHDGTPTSEISGGNTIFIEDTTAINATSVNSNTAWSIIFDGEVTLNTDDIEWTQISGPGSFIARYGLSRDGVIIDLDLDDLSTATITASDEIGFHDADGTANSSGSQTRKTTMQSLMDDLEIVNAVGTGTGIIVKTADGPPDTYTTRAIEVEGVGDLDGLAITDGDGVTGNPTLGLDIAGLPVRSDAIDGTDRVPVWNSSIDANEYYTISEIASVVGVPDSFSTWARAGNGTGADVIADSSADTVTITGGIGIDINTVPATDTVTWNFTNSGMANTAIATTDAIPFFDASNSDEAEFRTVSDLITDLGLLTSGNQMVFTSVTGDTGTATADTNSDTISLVGATSGGITTIATDGPESVLFSITPIDLVTGTATLALNDFIIVSDSTDTATTIAQKYTFTDVIDDLGILTSGNSLYWEDVAIGGNQLGDATVSPATAADTLTLAGGTGITASGSDASDTITFAFARVGLADTAITGADTVPFFDASNANDPEYRSWSNIITDLGLNTTGNTFFWGNINTTGNTVGDTTPAANPDASNDTLTFNAGIGITLTGTAVSDTLSWAFSRAGMADTAVVAADTIPFFDSSNTNEPEFRSFSDVFDDLDVPNGIGTNGIIVRTAADTYASRTIVASADEDELGATVTNGDGVAGNPTIGVDIVGQTDPDDDMAAADEFLVHDKSEGTAGANRKITGQNIADGVATILGLDNDLAFSTINGQEILTFTDPNRSKTLSIDSHTYQYSDDSLDDGSWIEIGNAIDTDVGHIMPFNGTLVGITAMSENPGGNTFEIDLFINGALSTAGIATLTGTGVDIDVDMTLDINFSQGDRLRLQVDRTAGTGTMGDTVVNLIVRWRA